MSYVSDLRTVKIEGPSGALREVAGGSFRGVPFYVVTHRYASGRRIAVSEHPGKDNPTTEDLGRATRAITLEGYLLGENVRSQLQDLLAALEEEGPGTLVHPYLGTKLVKCTAVEVQESATVRNQIGLTLAFIPEAETRAPVVVRTDARAAVLLAATDAKSLTASKFVKVFSIAKAGATALASAVKTTNSLLDQVESARNSLRQAAAYVAQLGTIRENLELLLLTPEDFAARVQSILTTTEGAVLPSGSGAIRRNVFVVGGAVTTTNAPTSDALLARVLLDEAMVAGTAGANTREVPNQGTPQRILEARNQAALLSLFQQTAIFDAAEKLVGAQISSVDEAVAVRDELAALFEGILTTTDDPEVYQVAQDTQAAALRYLFETTANLAVVLTLTPPRTVPALVQSYELYGTYQRASEIVERNRTPHPGFLPGGRPLEVLSK